MTEIRNALAQCENAFDIVAVLYNECGVIRNGRRRFHDVMNDLDDQFLLGKFNGIRHQISDDIAPLIQECLDNGNINLNPHALIQHYEKFRIWLKNAGYNTDIAAWVVILALDESFYDRDLKNVWSLYEDKPICPLNTNFKEGFPSIFLKIHPPIKSKLTPLSEKEITITSQMEYLVFAGNSDDLSQVDLIMDSQLWTDLESVQPKLAVISPIMAVDDFEIVDAAKEANVSRVFWVKAHESADYQQRIMNLLHVADDNGAVLAVFPELSSSESLEAAIARHLSTAKLQNLKLVALGSQHINQGSRKINRCSVIDRFGQVIWYQSKRERFKIPQDNEQYPGYSEWIETENKQVLIYTPIGEIAVQICLDFLQDNMRKLLCDLGCCWFLVPAMTQKLTGEFLYSVRNCGKLSGAICAVSNSRYSYILSGTNADAKDLQLSYQPIGGNASYLNDAINDEIWLININKDNG